VRHWLFTEPSADANVVSNRLMRLGLGAEAGKITNIASGSAAPTQFVYANGAEGEVGRGGGWSRIDRLNDLGWCRHDEGLCSEDGQAFRPQQVRRSIRPYFDVREDGP
jgi:hypothetical protein